MQSYLRFLDCRFRYIERASGRHKEACCGLETRCRYPAQGRGLSVPRRAIAARGCHSELLVSACITEPLSDKRRTRCDPAHATGNGHYGYSPVQPRGADCGVEDGSGGQSTFLEFLAASWRAGLVRYDVDFTARTVAYYGCNGEEYVETYPVVEVNS
jgi:hypothetical protein